jgi:hypothetical protein
MVKPRIPQGFTSSRFVLIEPQRKRGHRVLNPYLIFSARSATSVVEKLIPQGFLHHVVSRRRRKVARLYAQSQVFSDFFYKIPLCSPALILLPSSLYSLNAFALTHNTIELQKDCPELINL